MRTWSELHDILQEIIGINNKVYYQPPENVQMKYPCIVFERSNALNQYADNNPYIKTKRYMIKLITRTADNDEFVDQIMELPMCTYDRRFIIDNLVHDVFNIYF